MENELEKDEDLPLRVIGPRHCRKRMKESFPYFFSAYVPAANYKYGRHTFGILGVCQRATQALNAGRCFYAIVNCPPGHGKSDIISRRYPVWHLLTHEEDEIILASYGADLATELSRDARRCFEIAAPDFGIVPGRWRENSWGIEGHKGKLNATGLSGAITGRRANLLIIDDYLKNRIHAESESERRHQWESFQSDLMTRRAPIHAVIIVATRWHQDDLVGRILKWMAESESAPRFEVHRFQAQDEEGRYLFPAMFSPEYYESQKAWKYSWQSLYQNDPVPRSGNLLKADLVRIVEAMPDHLQWTRGWDLASTAKERLKDDPDFTVGTKVSFDNGVLYVDNVVRGQWESPERNRRILEAAAADGMDVEVYIEAVAGYKDAAKEIQTALHGKSVVRSTVPRGDKVARAAFLEPLFEAGNVVIRRAPWNDEWIAEMLNFPSGHHDDQVDSLALAAYPCVMQSSFGAMII